MENEDRPGPDVKLYSPDVWPTMPKLKRFDLIDTHGGMFSSPVIGEKDNGRYVEFNSVAPLVSAIDAALRIRDLWAPPVNEDPEATDGKTEEYKALQKMLDTFVNLQKGWGREQADG